MTANTPRVLGAQEGWGRLARFYREFRSEGGRFNGTDRARIAEAPYMKALLSALDLRGKRVLDAGCGFGYYARFAAEQGAQVVAMDYAPEMVELARQVLADQVGVEVCLGDVDDLSPFADRSFDVIISGLDLETPDLDGAFRGFSRVLVEKGAFLFSVPHPIIHHGEWRHSRRGRKLFFQLDHYFTRGLFTAQWPDEEGRAVQFDRQRRPLQDYTEALAANGFVISRLLEGEPAEEIRQTDPELYEELRRVPWYLIIQAAKER